MEIYQNNVFLHSTKLVYGSDIFKNTNLSTIALIPFSELNLSLSYIQNIKVNKVNFGDSIFLMYEESNE